MAQDLTSVQWANPQGNLTDEQKAQARTNIGAGQTTVTEFHGSATGSHETPLERITIYPADGLIMSNGGQVLAGVPVPQPEDEGKVLVAHVNDADQGVAQWKELETSQKIKHEFFNPAGGSYQQTILEVYQVPQLDGKWPTKIVGTFNCKPNNGYTAISILPLETYSRQLTDYPYTQETPTSFPDYPGSNNKIYPYTSPGDSRIKNITDLTTTKNNTVNFSLEQANSGDNKMLKYIAIKGAYSNSGQPRSNYNISNLNFTYYYDK